MILKGEIRRYLEYVSKDTLLKKKQHQNTIRKERVIGLVLRILWRMGLSAK